MKSSGSTKIDKNELYGTKSQEIWNHLIALYLKAKYHIRSCVEKETLQHATIIFMFILNAVLLVQAY